MLPTGYSAALEIMSLVAGTFEREFEVGPDFALDGRVRQGKPVIPPRPGPVCENDISVTLHGGWPGGGSGRRRADCYRCGWAGVVEQSYRTKFGVMYVSLIESFLDSEVARSLHGKVQLIFTSPPSR